MRRLGQHFLTDAGALKKIAAALRPRREETIIEIGPGHGELTRELRIQHKGLRIIAIEKDARLASVLKEKFADDTHIEIIEGDALKLLPSTTQHLTPTTYTIVGNIPYYITGFLLRVIQELKHKPRRTALTVQSEVAERIVATPPHMNKLAAAVQFWADPSIIARVPRTAFAPMPKVDSAIVVFETKKESGEILENRYYDIVGIIFKQPRKTLLNNLAEAYEGRSDAKAYVAGVLQSVGIPVTVRPQNLTIENIVALAEKLSIPSASLRA